MGCGCSGKSGVQWQANFGDGSTQTYRTFSEATAATKGVPGATVKAVAK